MKPSARLLAIRIWLSVAAVLVLGNFACAGLINGSFENSPDFSGWTTSTSGSTLDLQTSSNIWLPCTVTFNTGSYNQAIIFIGAYGNPTGRCWFDNLRPSGFSIMNPSFETVSGNSFTGWYQDGIGTLTHSSTEHVSSGARSAMFFDPSYAASMIRMWQIVNVPPNTNCSYTFDFYMEDSYAGAIRCAVYSADYTYYMGGLDSPDIDQLIADRSSFGSKSCRMTLTGGQASVYQTATVSSGMHMEAVANVKRKGLSGTVTLYIENAQTGAVIASAAASSANDVWQPVNVRFVSPSTQIRFRLAASGTGIVLADGMSLSNPILSPPAQEVTWKTASNDLFLPSGLGYSISGPYGDLLTTGINMLRSDLAARGVTLGQTGSQPTLIRISTSTGDWSKPESYRLSVGISGITIEAPTERGAFYGLMTVLQLITTNMSGQEVAVGCEIDDWPDLPWRALNRGISALTPEWMARHKLNVAVHTSMSEIDTMRRHGLEPIIHDNITHQQHYWGWWDPNLCEGVAGHDVFTLPTGVKRSLSGRNVINDITEGTDEIPVVNSSFESPSVEPDPYRGDHTLPAGWSVLSSPHSYIVRDHEAWGVPPPPDGSQSMSTYDIDVHDGFVYQNTGVRIRGGKTYTLSAHVLSNVPGNLAYLHLGGSNTPTGALDVTYWLSSATINPTTSWQQYSTSVTVPNDHPLVGKYLCVVLRSYYGWVNYDKVSVTSRDGATGSVKMRNMAGTITYAEGTDYILTAGVTAFPYLPTADPYQIERKPGGAIADGQTVQVDYEHVPDYSPFVLCLAEDQPQDQQADWAEAKVDEYDLDYIGMHVSESPSTIGKGPRSQSTGLSASQLLGDYYRRLDRSVKAARPNSRILAYADDFMDWQHAPRSGLGDMPALLPNDAILHCWYYNPSGAVEYNKQSTELWSGLGHEFLLMGWYDYLNIHITAAAARWAKLKGMPCLGISSWAYNPDGGQDVSLWMVETANCAWRVPRPGEEGYFDFEGAAEGTHSQSQLGRISMHIELEDFVGDKSLTPVKVELLKSGVVKYQAMLTLDSTNDCYITDIVPDTYDVRLSAARFQRKVVPGVEVPPNGTGTMTTALVNGDLNGDNVVTAEDVNIVIPNLSN